MLSLCRPGYVSFFILVVSCSPALFLRGYIFFNLHLLISIPVEYLLTIFHIPYQTQLRLCFTFPDPIPMYFRNILILFPGKNFLVPLPIIFLLTFQFDQDFLSQSMPAYCLPCLISYMWEKSCTLRVMYIKTCYLYSNP